MARSVLLRWHDACPFNGPPHQTILLQLRIVSRIGLCVPCLSNIEQFESSMFVITRVITDRFKLLLV